MAPIETTRLETIGPPIQKLLVAQSIFAEWPYRSPDASAMVVQTLIPEGSPTCTE
jgi:hypothetical protein